MKAFLAVSVALALTTFASTDAKAEVGSRGMVKDYTTRYYKYLERLAGQLSLQDKEILERDIKILKAQGCKIWKQRGRTNKAEKAHHERYLAPFREYKVSCLSLDPSFYFKVVQCDLKWNKRKDAEHKKDCPDEVKVRWYPQNINLKVDDGNGCKETAFVVVPAACLCTSRK